MLPKSLKSLSSSSEVSSAPQMSPSTAARRIRAWRSTCAAYICRASSNGAAHAWSAQEHTPRQAADHGNAERLLLHGARPLCALRRDVGEAATLLDYWPAHGKTDNATFLSLRCRRVRVGCPAPRMSSRMNCSYKLPQQIFSPRIKASCNIFGVFFRSRSTVSNIVPRTVTGVADTCQTHYGQVGAYAFRTPKPRKEGRSDSLKTSTRVQTPLPAVYCRHTLTRTLESRTVVLCARCTCLLSRDTHVFQY